MNVCVADGVKVNVGVNVDVGVSVGGTHCSSNDRPLSRVVKRKDRAGCCCCAAANWATSDLVPAKGILTVKVWLWFAVS